MRIAPLKSLPQATLILALLCASYPLAHQATPDASAQGQPTRTQRPTPTPTPTPRRRATSQTGQADRTPTPTPTPTPKPESDGMSTGKKIAIGAAIIGGGLAGFGIAKSGGGGSVSSGDLSKHGPFFPQVFTMTDFKAKGFAQGDWPVFVVYELPQPASVTLTIEAEKVAPFVQTVEGKTGTNDLRINLPARFKDKKPRVTDFVLSAVSNNPSTPPAEPVAFDSVSFSVGPNAVGSSGIDNVTFQPGSVFATTQSQKANYKFYSRFDFDKVTADFMLIGRNTKGEIAAKRVGREKFDKGIKRGAWLEKQWDCRADKKVSQGKHQLQVRGWQGLKNGGSWVATMSKQFVRIQ